MYLDDVSYILTSEMSFKILNSLHFNTHLTPTQIAKITHISRSNISTKLIKLKKKGLVVCVTPERKKGRLYKLTDKGKDAVVYAKKLKFSKA